MKDYHQGELHTHNQDKEETELSGTEKVMIWVVIAVVGYGLYKLAMLSVKNQVELFKNPAYVKLRQAQLGIGAVEGLADIMSRR